MVSFEFFRVGVNENTMHMMRRQSIVLLVGVQTNDNRYTCPVLAVHTWHKSGHKTEMQRSALQGTQNNGGAWSKRDRISTVLTVAGRDIEYKMGLSEDVQIIPVEDVVSVKVNSAVEKAVQHKQTTRLKTPPPEDQSCCQKVTSCCMTKVFCCCNKKRQVVPEHETMDYTAQQASRHILITVEHTRYSHINSSSVVRVLPSDKQAEFYQNHFEVDTLQFYSLHNSAFDEQEYNEQMLASEALARFIMQLKAMVDHYPDQEQLALITRQQPVQLLGIQPMADKVNMVDMEEVTHPAIRSGRAVPSDD